MKKKPSPLLSISLATALAFGTVTPSMAGMVPVPKASEISSSVTLIQERWRDGRRGPEFRDRRDRRQYRRGDRFERRGNVVYWRGHRGYRERRPGYRRYNGWWFPPAAFALGAIIGGALAQPPVRTLSSAHVEWCYARYRSYRASDNTFQPYNGPRRPCISPYS